MRSLFLIEKIPRLGFLADAAEIENEKILQIMPNICQKLAKILTKISDFNAINSKSFAFTN